MKIITAFSLRKFQKKNLNKFFQLKNVKNTGILVKNSGILKENHMNCLDTLLRKKLKNFSWAIQLIKNRTKKPISSKLGGGKGKIDYRFKGLKKYSRILKLNLNLKNNIREFGLVSNFKLKNVK